MGSIKGFIDWVKGSELEDDYEDEMPRQRNEEPAMDSAVSYTHLTLPTTNEV